VNNIIKYVLLKTKSFNIGMFVSSLFSCSQRKKSRISTRPGATRPVGLSDPGHVWKWCRLQ